MAVMIINDVTVIIILAAIFEFKGHTFYYN